jgi:hypothetical protein
LFQQQHQHQQAQQEQERRYPQRHPPAEPQRALYHHS